MNVATTHDTIGQTNSVGMVPERLGGEIVEDASSSIAYSIAILFCLVDEKVGKSWGVAPQTSTPRPFAWSSGDRRTGHVALGKSGAVSCANDAV